MKIDSKFTDFISKHHVMTLATISKDGSVSCCALFYVYLEEENVFIFTSSKETQHAENIENNNNVAANIILETKVIGKIEGLQIKGLALRASETSIKNTKIEYLKKYPYAVFMDLDLWVLKPTMFKLTDNKLGFGNKLIWSDLRDVK